MKKRIKFKNGFFSSLIIIVSFFMSIGYASVNSVILDINSSVTVKANKGLYISNVEITDENNALGYINIYDGRFLKCTTNLSMTDPASTVTYKITITNNTPYIYGYSNTKYIIGENTYDNENIIFEINGITTETELNSNESITFYITFKYNDPSNITNNILHSELSFIFKNLSAMQLSSLIKLNEAPLVNSGLSQFENKYYFVGSNVNNNIWYNCQEGYSSGSEYCEKWRIVSIEEDDAIKIVKDEPISQAQITALEAETSFWRTNTSEWITNTKILAAGKIIYDPKGRRPTNQSLTDSYCINTNNGCNAYASNQNIVGTYKNLNVDADSLIKIYLENIYYPYGLTTQAKGQIKEYTYSIGLVGVDLDINSIIEKEKSITINSNIGLLNPSDYVIISNDTNCKTNFTRYHNSSCKTTNWLPITDKQYHMMNGKILSTDDKNAQIWTVNTSGAIISQDANNEFYLRPVVVLDKNVQAIGLGTNEDYYMLVS